MNDDELLQLLKHRLGDIFYNVKYWNRGDINGLDFLDMARVLIGTAEDYNNSAIEYMDELENCVDQDERLHLEYTIKEYGQTVDECKDGAKFLISLYELVNK